MFATLDINAIGVVFGEDLWKKDGSLFLDQWEEVQEHYAEIRQATSLSLHLYTSILVHRFYL